MSMSIQKTPTKLRKVGQNSVCCRRCGEHGHNRRTCTTPLEKSTKNVVGEKGDGSWSMTELGTSKGIRVAWRGRGDKVNTPTNFAQASQTSHVTKSTTTQVTKSQKVQKLASLSSLHATSCGSQN